MTDPVKEWRLNNQVQPESEVKYWYLNDQSVPEADQMGAKLQALNAPIPDRTALDAILGEIHIAGASVLNDRFKIIIHRGPAGSKEFTEKVPDTFSVTKGKIAEILDKDYCRPHQSQVGFIKQILDALGLKYKTPSIWDVKIHSFLDQLIKEEKSIINSPTWQAKITRLHCKQDLRRTIAKLLTVDDSEAAKQLLDGLVNEELVRHIHNS